MKPCARQGPSCFPSCRTVLTPWIRALAVRMACAHGWRKSMGVRSGIRLAKWSRLARKSCSISYWLRRVRATARQKLALGICDTPAVMAVKSHLRNSRPVLIAVSTNDGLGRSAANIGALMGMKHIYFVPSARMTISVNPIRWLPIWMAFPRLYKPHWKANSFSRCCCPACTPENVSY